jgi:preprotein translocase subunit SecB
MIENVPEDFSVSDQSKDGGAFQIKYSNTTGKGKSSNTNFQSMLGVAVQQIGTGDKNPVVVEISILGRFKILGEKKEITEEKTKFFKEQSAPAILYGIARGVVAMMTGMSQHGRMVWPTLNLKGLCEKENALLVKTAKKVTKKSQELK